MTPSDPRAPYTIRTRPEDFVVVEEPKYPASGRGDHLFVLVEKTGRTTEQVAQDLARSAGISSRDVGYAGRKDRHALTQQWFSLPGVQPETARDFDLEGARVLEAIRHEHKLRTGHLRGNRFDLAVRCEADCDVEAVRRRAEELVRRGMPNRYGEQRFGRSGDNAEAARRLLAGGRPPRDRRAARFLVSALQAEVFNAVLAERVDEIDRVRLGDLARVEESGGLFWVDDPEGDSRRAEAFEISATGPIFGRKMRAPRDEVARIEESVFARFDLPAPRELVLPRGIRVLGGRRPLRVRPVDLEVGPLEEGGGLRIRFGLPSGAYATVLLEALVGPVVDASRRRDRVSAVDPETGAPAPAE